jgi:hypothetical protein
MRSNYATRTSHFGLVGEEFGPKSLASEAFAALSGKKLRIGTPVAFTHSAKA